MLDGYCRLRALRVTKPSTETRSELLDSIACLHVCMTCMLYACQKCRVAELQSCRLSCRRQMTSSTPPSRPPPPPPVRRHCRRRAVYGRSRSRWPEVTSADRSWPGRLGGSLSMDAKPEPAQPPGAWPGARLEMGWMTD